MNNVNKTLYIPLYGKSFVSKKGILLEDKKAEEIWAAEGFELKGKSKSKWLAYYMGMRSAAFDSLAGQRMADMEDAIVLHLGCGMDSRAIRMGTKGHLWYDVDFEEVIAERKRYYEESADYTMVAGNLTEADWLATIPEGKSAIVIMEGVSMYLTPEQLQNLMTSLCGHFEELVLLMDCYTTFAAKMSKYKNPINDVGVTQVYGMDGPELLEQTGLTFVEEHSMTPENLIDQLDGSEKQIFKKLYAGKFSQKLYRLYEYRKVQE